jgi:hypothetical protein
MDYNTPFYIRNAILCIGFLAGMGCGVFLITRRHTLAGILAIVGFILFSLEPLADIVIYRVLYSYELSEDVYTALDWGYACISTIAFLIGSIALVIALLDIARSKRQVPQAQLEDQIEPGKG